MLYGMSFLASLGCAAFAEMTDGVPGLASHYLADTWTKERGLPDNSIRAITQTPDGYLWVATRAGLARFDGVRFVVFNRANTPALPSDEFTSLTPGRNGDLWIGTANGLVHRSASGYSSWLSGLPGRSSEISSVFITRAGDVWVGSRLGVYRFRGTQLEMTSWPGIPVLEEESGMLWLAGGKGFHRFDPTSGQISELLVPPDLPVWGAANSAGLVALPNGDIWAQFGQHERIAKIPKVRNWLYAFKDGRWTRLPGTESSNHGRPFFLSTDRENALWFPDGSTRVLRLKEGALARLAFPPNVEADFPTCMFHDSEGSIWIGLEDKGLVRFRPKKIFTLTENDGLPNNNSWALSQARDGALWIGTDGGVSRWQHDKLTNFAEGDGLAKNSVRALAEDRQGTIWVGTGDGLTFFRNGTWNRFALPGGIGANKIRALHLDRAGDLWIASATGLAQLRNHVPVPCAPAKDLLDIDVRALCQDRSGALWIGTEGYGLCRARGATLDRFTVTNGLVSDIVWAIFEDAEGALWFGGDSGLQRFSNGKLHKFTRREGLPYDDVNQILEDDSGNLWISSDYGIYRVSKRALEDVAQGRQPSVSAVAYGVADGLLGVETNGRKSQPAGCKTRDGRLWFPTTRGVVSFDPRGLPDNPHPPRGIIEQIRADGQIIFHNGPPLADGEIETRHVQPRRAGRFATLDRELRLPPGSAHVLEIQYSANTFIEADKVSFQYRLDGLDEDWVAAGTRRFAHYSNLKPGHYRFRVLAASKYGLFSPATTAFAFYIQPHFYQRKVFYALCLSAVALAGLAFYRWRLRYLRQIHRLEQERALAEDRARIARDLHDGLGAQLTNLTILADTSAQRADAAQTSDTRFRKLSQLARETALQLREIIWANHPGDESLEGLINRICQYAQQTLDVAGISCQFEIPSALPPEPLNIHARHHFYLIVKEILHNTLKHASATGVCIYAALKHDELHLTIQDNGRGFAPARGREKANGPFPNGGRGLENIRRRIKSLGGDLLVTSDPGEGVCFQISVPLQSLFVVQAPV
jgi:ligand-binding sensor domain-containing protein/signal transduction histidine kinase